MALAIPATFGIAGIPFYPQDDFQCGPASLASAITFATDTPVTPEQLTALVFTPARKGSLALDLIGASRRQGLLAYRLRPDLDTLLQEVSAGHPVVILQNLAFNWYPIWHYAVVTGYDLPAREIVLNSGHREHLRMPLRTFEHTWARGGYWALLILKPGNLPQTAEATPLLQAGAGLEQAQQWGAAISVYQSAIQRWPAAEAAYLGLGNSHYALKQLPQAAAALRQGLEKRPDSAALHNNLAQVLLESGQAQEALSHARSATQIAPGQTLFQDTLKDIEHILKLR